MVPFKAAASLALVGAISIAALQPASAAPLTGLSAAAKPSVEDGHAVQVHYRGWGGGGAAIGAGLLAGAVIGSAIAAPSYYGGYGYHGGYGYYGGYRPYPSYGYSYVGSPSYGYGGGYYPAYVNRPYYGGYGYGYAPRRVYRSYGYVTPRPWRHSYGYYRGPGWHGGGHGWHGNHFGPRHGGYGVVRARHW